MTYSYKTSGTCSKMINLDIEDGIIKNIEFEGGCMGNTTGVANLAKGRSVDEVISLVDGIPCGVRGTSCPDQLAKALKEYKEKYMA